MPVRSPATLPAGAVLSSAFWNTEVRDQFAAFMGAWTPYTPVWTAATTNPAGYTPLGRFVQIGKLVVANVQFSGAGTTFGNGAYSFSLPVPASGVAALQFGNGGRGTAGTGIYIATTPLIVGAGTTFLLNAPSSPASNALVTVGSTGLAGTAWASGYSINNTISYEAA